MIICLVIPSLRSCNMHTQVFFSVGYFTISPLTVWVFVSSLDSCAEKNLATWKFCSSVCMEVWFAHFNLLVWRDKKFNSWNQVFLVSNWLIWFSYTRLYIFIWFASTNEVVLCSITSLPFLLYFLIIFLFFFNMILHY